MIRENTAELPTPPNATDVRWYVLRRGWKPQSTKNPSLLVFNAPGDRIEQLHVPTSGNDRDVGFMMSEVIRKLAAAEDRPVGDVWHDVLHPFEDTLRLRVQSRATEAGTLMLTAGLKLFQGGRDLLLAAACSVHQPQPYYSRKSYTPVEEFIQKCQVGQTAIGSYVATILTPPMAPAEPTLFDSGEDTAGDAPFPRRVTLTLREGLGILNAAAQSGDGALITSSVQAGVSANLCEALSGILPPEENAILQVEMGWAPVRPKVSLMLARPLRFAAPDLAFIGEAGRRLRRSVLRPETLQGRIISLKEDAPLLQDYHGRVTIRALVEDKMARIRFDLSKKDYILACDAHRDKKAVQVMGVLQLVEQSKLYVLNDVKHFTVLSSN